MELGLLLASRRGPGLGLGVGYRLWLGLGLGYRLVLGLGLGYRLG